MVASLESEQVLERLSSVERQLRNSRWFLRMAMVAFLLLLVAQAQPPTQQSPATPKRAPAIEASEVVIVDKEGRSRARLGLLESGAPFLHLIDPKGVPLVELIGDESVSRLTIRDTDGKTGVELAHQTKDMKLRKVPSVSSFVACAGPRLDLYDSTGVAIGLAVMDDDRSLRFSDQSEDRYMRLSMKKDGSQSAVLSGEAGRVSVSAIPSPTVAIHDQTGRRRCHIGLTPRGTPSLTLVDEYGTDRATLGAAKLVTTRTDTVEILPESSLVLFDKDGRVLHKAP